VNVQLPIFGYTHHVTLDCVRGVSEELNCIYTTEGTGHTQNVQTVIKGCW